MTICGIPVVTPCVETGMRRNGLFAMDFHQAHAQLDFPPLKRAVMLVHLLQRLVAFLQKVSDSFERKVGLKQF